jgi:hypothetical protein
MTPAVVDRTDRAALAEALEHFADAVTERDDGTLVAEFGASAHFAVEPDGSVDAGMALHDFEGPADRLAFDHDGGSIDVEFDADSQSVVYTFRRP